jgi:hypothetical protein
MRGVALAVSGVEGGHREAARVRAFEAAVAALAVWPGEEDDRAGLAGPAKGRGPVAGGGNDPMGGQRGVGRPGWKERRAAAGPNLELGQNSKRFFLNFN